MDAKRILITGASGALGHALLESARIHEVQRIGLSRSQPGAQADASWITADLLQAPGDALSDHAPTHLIHAAWVTDHPGYWNSAANFQWQSASLTLLEAFARAGGRHFTFIGTCAEYDWTNTARAGDPVTGYPATLYGASKLLVTQVLAARAAELGIGFTCCRMFFPYSSRENGKRIISQLVDTLLRDDAFHMRSGDVFRDIYGIAGAADLITRLTLEGQSGIFDVSSGKATHLGQFLRDTFCAALGLEDRLTWDIYDPQRENPATNPQRLVGNAGLLAPLELPKIVDEAEIEKIIQARKDAVS